jgi:hypothetical protein
VLPWLVPMLDEQALVAKASSSPVTAQSGRWGADFGMRIVLGGKGLA